MVRVVTDSTACLPEPNVTVGIWEVPLVVPLYVVTPDGVLREGVDITADEVAERLRAGQKLSTSQPAPEDFLTTGRALDMAGAKNIVSVHLSSHLSGTSGAAELAFQKSAVDATVVDSGTVSMALGFAAQAAAASAAEGLGAADVARRAAWVARNSHVWFLVDSLEWLRRGGRITAGAAALGTALGVRPILTIVDGVVKPYARVRTKVAAQRRLMELALAQISACAEPVVAVHHLGAAERAEAIATVVEQESGVKPVVTALSAVLGVHCGPGTVAIVVADLAEEPEDAEPGDTEPEGADAVDADAVEEMPGARARVVTGDVAGLGAEAAAGVGVLKGPDKVAGKRTGTRAKASIPDKTPRSSPMSTEVRNSPPTA